QGVSRPYSDPLQNELEKLCELKNNISKSHEVVKLRLKSDHDKELAEVIAEMNRKYEAKCQDAEAAFQSKRVEIDTIFKKVVKNKMLADAYRSKCQDMSPFDPAVLRAASSNSSPAANLFSSTPTRPNPSSIPIRPPQSTSIPSTTPTRPQPINPLTPSTRPPSTTGPINTPSRPPPVVSPMTPSIRLNIPPLNINPPSNRPPPNINPIIPKESQAYSIFDVPNAEDGPTDGSSIPFLGSFSDTSSLFPNLSRWKVVRVFVYKLSQEFITIACKRIGLIAKAGYRYGC
nr:hypothetical protein [Tanacetum cinerariifolium]